MQKPGVASLRSDRHQLGTSDGHDIGIVIDIVGIATGESGPLATDRRATPTAKRFSPVRAMLHSA
jgi:hypothetical protein